MRSRRSVRRFREQPIPDEVIQDILSTAIYAPSAHNRQPWRFVVLKDTTRKELLADAMVKDFARDLRQDGVSEAKIEAQIQRSRDRLLSAPLVIVLCLDMSEMDSYPDEKRRQAERTMAIQSVAAAGLQLLLAAHAEGLAGVWVCSPLFAGETIQQTLQLSETWEPQGMFYLGAADKLPAPRERKGLESIVQWI